MHLIHFSALQARGPFLEGPETFSHSESRSKISNLIIRAVSFTYSYTARSYFHKRSLRHIHLPAFTNRWTKNGFQGPKSFWGFGETGPRVRLFKTRLSQPRINENIDVSFVTFSAQLSVYIVWPSVLDLNNLKLHKTLKRFYIEEKLVQPSTFNPGLALTSFRIACRTGVFFCVF